MLILKMSVDMQKYIYYIYLFMGKFLIDASVWHVFGEALYCLNGFQINWLKGVIGNYIFPLLYYFLSDCFYFSIEFWWLIFFWIES